MSPADMTVRMDRSSGGVPQRDVLVELPSVVLEGSLTLPHGARTIVVFAHGSGSSRLSRRNRFVSEVLVNAGHATLLFDLLTAKEELVDRSTGHLRFDVDLLATRLEGATDWLSKRQETAAMSVGYFGASTGAAAALIAAANRPEGIGAVVSRGGRPDLAGPALARVRAPTLLIVGAHDFPVIPLNERALQRLTCEKALETVPDATHLFEEPGTLERAAKLASDWFSRWL